MYLYYIAALLKLDITECFLWHPMQVKYMVTDVNYLFEADLSGRPLFVFNALKQTHEPRFEKTSILHMRKQRRRSVSR